MPIENKLHALKAKIDEAPGRIEFDGYDSVTQLVEELQHMCPHVEKKVYDGDTYVCTYCGKLFKYET